MNGNLHLEKQSDEISKSKLENDRYYENELGLEVHQVGDIKTFYNKSEKYPIKIQ